MRFTPFIDTTYFCVCRTPIKVVISEASIAQLALFSNILSFCYRCLFKSITSPQNMIKTINSIFSLILFLFFVFQFQSMNDYFWFCCFPSLNVVNELFSDAAFLNSASWIIKLLNVSTFFSFLCSNIQ